MNFLYKVIIILLVNYSSLFGQKIFKNVEYQTIEEIYISNSGVVPFWQQSNKYGTAPFKTPTISLSGSIHKEYDSTYTLKEKIKIFDLGYGINTHLNVGTINKVLLPEAYIKVRFKSIELYAGRRKEILGLTDTSLTSGSYIWSGNAIPIPKVQIGIPNYVSIIGKGLISIKGAYAHGWFDNGYIKDFYLHQKWFYVKIGKQNWKVKVYAGFNHQAQWGGKYSAPQKDSNGLIIEMLPSSLSDYLHVVSGISINTGDDGNATGRPLNESWNRIGNHLGTIDFGTEIDFSKLKVLVYRQSIYEDGSLFYLNNIEDGLSGISIRGKNIKSGIYSFILEYLNTTSQGGLTDSNNTIPQLRGRDNYFNNSIYRSGWSYGDKTPIGTPFIPNTLTILPKLPKNSNNFTSNNSVQAVYLGLQGKHKSSLLTLKYSLSYNYGTFDLPYNKIVQSAYFFSIYKTYKEFKVLSSIEFNEGKLFKNAFGFNFKIIKNWW